MAGSITRTYYGNVLLPVLLTILAGSYTHLVSNLGYPASQLNEISCFIFGTTQWFPIPRGRRVYAEYRPVRWCIVSHIPVVHRCYQR